LAGRTVTKRPPWESMWLMASAEASLQSDTYKKSVRPSRATSSFQVGTWVMSSLVLPDSTR
jgi:hypothetical protein